MLSTYPHLFAVVTPILVDHLEALLSEHPNQPFTQSVFHGLCDGFWAWAVTNGINHPITIDNSVRPLPDPMHITFVCKQRDMEIALDCFSRTFGPPLLPHMTTILLGIVLKPHSDKLWLVIDHSTGDFLPNSYITRAHVCIPLDNLHDLGERLITACKEFSFSTQFVVFKTDISQAYHRIPVHPLWQLFQIVTIDGVHHVDWNNNFGNCAASGLWGSLMGLVLWIASVRCNLDISA